MTELLKLTASLPTPFIAVEERVVRRNIQRIHEYAEAHGFAVRPHIKTHKSLFLAGMQLNAGAAGLAAAKVGEAAVMAELGPVDITIAYPAVGEIRAKRIAELAQRLKIRVAADSEFVLKQLAQEAVRHHATIGIMVIFDAGLHRCGVAGVEQLTGLARFAAETPGLCYDGIQMYLGHLYGDSAEDPRSFEQINTIWEPVYQALCKAGSAPETVSSGSTPSLWKTHLVRHVNEIRVGTAVLNDYFVMKFNHCAMDACAARVVATVVSDVTPGRVIIDAGSKALSAKQLLQHENLEMGYVVEYPDAVITRLHEEHGWVDVRRCADPPKTGRRLSIIPVNISLCMNLHDSWYLITENGDARQMPVDARGCLV